MQLGCFLSCYYTTMSQQWLELDTNLNWYIDMRSIFHENAHGPVYKQLIQKVHR